MDSSNDEQGKSTRRERHDAFSAKKKREFLKALAQSCHVIRSAKFAKVHSVTVYDHRKKDPEFARGWQEALAAGYDRLEAQALEAAGAGGAIDGEDPFAGEPFDFNKAMVLLRHHRSQRETGQPRTTPGPKLRNASRDETNAALLKAIAAVRKRLAAEKKR